MFCPHCGTANDDNNFRCVKCQQVIQLQAQRVVTADIEDSAAIVQAAQVNGKVQAGDIAGAEQCARKARNWSLWGLGVGLVVYGSYFVLMVIGAVAGSR